MKFTIRIRKEENGQLKAWCPSLPGCSVTGPTHEVVFERIERAIRSYLASLDAFEPAKVEPQLMSA